MKSSHPFVALVFLTLASTSAQAGILDWFGRMPNQETLEKHEGNYVIREEVTFRGDEGRARTAMGMIYNMSEWSPLTGFRGQNDVGKLPVASITTSSGTEEINLIITEKTYSDEGSTLCGRSTGLLYNQQFCRRLTIQENGDIVYESEILVDGMGIIKAKREENEIRKALRAEVEGFANYIETAEARNEQAKIDNAHEDMINKIMRDAQEADKAAVRAAKDVRMHRAEAQRLREVAAEFSASPREDLQETAKERLAQAVEQDQKAVAKEKKAAELATKAAQLKAELRAKYNINL